MVRQFLFGRVRKGLLLICRGIDVCSVDTSGAGISWSESGAKIVP